jgi:hypothetical protein
MKDEAIVFHLAKIPRVEPVESIGAPNCPLPPPITDFRIHEVVFPNERPPDSVRSSKLIGIRVLKIAAAASSSGISDVNLSSHDRGS